MHTKHECNPKTNQHINGPTPTTSVRHDQSYLVSGSYVSEFWRTCLALSLVTFQSKQIQHQLRQQKTCIHNTGGFYHHNFGTNAKKFIKCLCIHTTELEKHIFRPVMTTTASTYSKESCLFYIWDSCHRYEFLVDTDAEISVIILTPEKKLTPDGQKLTHTVGNHSH